MGLTKLGDVPAHTRGDLPPVGSPAPNFVLTANDMSEVTLGDFKGKNIVMNIFPSIDTRVCATSVREFNKRAASLSDTVVLCISKDLPFAMRRFCGAEGIDKVITLSDFRDKGFSKSYGVTLIDSNFEGLHARAIVVVDSHGTIRHTELVPVIGQEPDYDAALKSL